MLPLLWLACGPTGPVVTLPSVAGAGAASAVPVVVVTADAVWVDARPWADAVPDATLAQVDAWATADTQGLLVPGLDAALGKLVAVRPFEPALAVDAEVPFQRVARVLYTVGQRGAPGVEIRVTRGPGAAEGAVRYPFPTYCGANPADPAQVARLQAMLKAAPTGPCLAPSVTEVDGGLRVELLPIGQDKPGCTVAVAQPPSGPVTSWENAVAVPAAGACPSVPGRDATALSALLGRTASLQQACGSAWVAMRDSTPWGETVPVFAAVQSRHPAASLGIAGTAVPGCERAFPLP